ncbi:pyridoxamine 5'-phosphate oxidase family protein [Nitratireductor sp. XY-223]|uniref:FAD-binding oxidoreductase n=1 Tax=Nitratireductor sp. XY-223 TaxID=2561926 RepID=UPI0010AA059A|nr:pyridoxamine 5'-phosphate oxidase family protein [Nitratireductor sp. XY-223]
MLNNPALNEDLSPFHDGEQAVQERLGARGIETWARHAIRDHMPEQHRSFYAALPHLVVAARDAQGRPWATVLTGRDGFVRSPDPRRLAIDARPPSGDALEHAFKDGDDIGILGIEFTTRRRNRINGRLATSTATGLEIDVEQTFGNCPQYIHARGPQYVDGHRAGAPRRGRTLTDRQMAFIATADTLFIASGYRGLGDNPAYGMDASHRGGEAGFVEVIDGKRIRFPDYAGNNRYNSIGNITLDPRAGLLFVDFATGSMLQLTGRAFVEWNAAQTENTPETGRAVTLEIEEVVALPHALPLHWDTDAGMVRSLRLIEKTPESADVTSFVFEARDGGPLPEFVAGQHLPIELSIPGTDSKVTRTYSLSGAPGTQRYRISVKREAKGLVSRFLHDSLETGAIIEAEAPGGDFTLPKGAEPLVLVSAGVGVTPMVSMLHALAEHAGDRPVHFVHGARDGAHHPFAEEVRALASKHPNVSVRVVYSRPRDKDLAGRDYDDEGHIDAGMLAALTDARAAQYLICGPMGFLADVTDGLVRRGIESDRIHTETFGPHQAPAIQQPR